MDNDESMIKQYFYLIEKANVMRGLWITHLKIASHSKFEPVERNVVGVGTLGHEVDSALATVVVRIHQNGQLRPETHNYLCQALCKEDPR